MISTMRCAVSIGAAVTAAALLLMPTAAASPDSSGNDGMFLDQLVLTQATLPAKTPAEMVAAGYATCQDLRNGVTVLDEMSSVEEAYHFSQGTLFVSAATTNLCPDFAG